MSGTYPNLGFDPAPGMPGAVEGLQTQLVNTKRELDTAYELVGGVGRTGGIWEGEAAEAFNRRMDELPRHLEKGRLSLSEASTALQSWHGQLVGFQRRAAGYEQQAVRVRGNLSDAESAYERARRNPELDLAGQYFSTDAELRDAQARLNAAQAQLDQAITRVRRLSEELDEVIGSARALRDEHHGASRDTARAIRKAAEEHAPPEPGWWDKVKDFFSGVGEWIAEHSKIIGDVLAAISAIAGIVALFFPPAAIVAVLAGAGALGMHAWGLHRKGKLGWNLQSVTTLAGDALSMVPGLGAARSGVSALRGGRGLVGAMRTFGDDIAAKGGTQGLSLDFYRGSKWVVNRLDLGWNPTTVAKGVQTTVDGTLATQPVAGTLGELGVIDKDNPIATNPVLKYAGLARGVHGATGAHWTHDLPEVGHDTVRLGREGAHDLADVAREGVHDARGVLSGRSGDPDYQAQEVAHDTTRKLDELEHNTDARFRELQHNTNRDFKELHIKLEMLAGAAR